MPRTNNKKRSVTIQTEQENWEALEKLARLAGHTYMGEGNVSWATNQTIAFWKDHQEEYRAWMTEKMSGAMEG